MNTNVVRQPLNVSKHTINKLNKMKPHTNVNWLVAAPLYGWIKYSGPVHQVLQSIAEDHIDDMLNTSGDIPGFTMNKLLKRKVNDVLRHINDNDLNIRGGDVHIIDLDTNEFIL